MNILTNLSLKRYAYEKVCSQECETLCSITSQWRPTVNNEKFFSVRYLEISLYYLNSRVEKLAPINVIVIFRSTCK